MKPNFVMIPFMVLVVAAAGAEFTQISEWYLGLQKPGFQPPAHVFGPIWFVLYMLIAASALIAWNKASEEKRRLEIATLFVINAFLSVLWSFIFFQKQALEGAFYELLLLNLSTLLLIIVIWPHQYSRRFLLFFHKRSSEKNSGWLKVAALLLFPYLVWGSFAAYLNYVLMQLN